MTTVIIVLVAVFAAVLGCLIWIALREKTHEGHQPKTVKMDDLSYIPTQKPIHPPTDPSSDENGTPTRIYRTNTFK